MRASIASGVVIAFCLVISAVSQEVEEKSTEISEEERALQIAALQVLYGVKGAVEKAGDGDAAPLFADAMKEIEFANEKQKKEALNAAFVSVCSTGVKKEVDLMLAQGVDLEAKIDGQEEGSEQFTGLMWAAYGGHLEIVQDLVGRGANLEAQSGRGYTALILAATAGEMKVVEYLISQGANVEAKGQDGGTALLHASAAGKREVVDFLIKQGADIDVKHVDGGTVLTEFAGEGWDDLVKQMVKRGMDLEVRGKDGWTPLLVAATAGHVKAAEELLAGKANINALGDNGESALIVACASSQKAMAQMLLKKGADVSIVHKRGGTALIEAAGEGWNDVVQELIKKKADVNVQDENGFDALMVSCAAGKADVVNTLLKAGENLETVCVIKARTNLRVCIMQAGANPNQVNKAKGTALHEACAIGDQKIVEALLKAKAEADTANESGHTGLIMAATNGYQKDPKGAIEIVKLLAGKGAKVDASGEDKRTSLFLAAMSGFKDMVELLIKHKAELDSRDKNQFTPLMAAAASGQDEVLAVLIKAGANIEAKHEKGGTALHACASAGLPTIVEQLLNGTFAKIADVNAVDEDEDTPLHLAVMRGHYDTIIPLLKHGANYDAKNKAGKSPMSIAEEYKEQAPHLVSLLKTGGDKEKVKEFLMEIIAEAKKEREAAAAEGEGAEGQKKLGKVPADGKTEL